MLRREEDGEDAHSCKALFGSAANKAMRGKRGPDGTGSAISGGPYIHCGGRDGGSISMGGLLIFGTGIGPNGSRLFGTGTIGIEGIQGGSSGASGSISCSIEGASHKSGIPGSTSTEFGDVIAYPWLEDFQSRTSYLP